MLSLHRSLEIRNSNHCFASARFARRLSLGDRKRTQTKDLLWSSLRGNASQALSPGAIPSFHHLQTAGLAARACLTVSAPHFEQLSPRDKRQLSGERPAPRSAAALAAQAASQPLLPCVQHPRVLSFPVNKLGRRPSRLQRNPGSTVGQKEAKPNVGSP